MSGTGKIKRLCAVFVLAFICLNAAGAVCVAYCRGFEAETAAEHPRQLSEHRHCDEPDATGAVSETASISDETDCCPMTVSFFAGPIEKDRFALDSIGETVEMRHGRFELPAASFKYFSSAVNYRGPPLGRRVDRLKHCILRI